MLHKELINSERKIFAFIILFFVINVAFRFYLSNLSGTPIVFQDELLYMKTARSLFEQFNTDFRSNYFISDNILYPLVISISFIFKNSADIYSCMKFINCLFMSAVIFPVYYLSKKILDNISYAFIVAIISLLVPDMFQTALIMQESLYYFITMITFYYLYLEIVESKNECSTKITLILGFLLFLCYFTKAIGLVLLTSYCLYILIEYIFLRRYPIRILLKRIFFVVGTFLVFFMATKFFVRFINGFPDTNSLYAGAISFHINLAFIEKALYGIFIYIYYTLLAFLIIPVLVVVFGISKENSSLNMFSLYVLFATGISIVTIDLLIFTKETVDVFETRLLIRYLFIFFPLYLIIAIKHLQNRNVKLKNKFMLIALSSVVVLSPVILDKFKLSSYSLFFEAPMLAYFNLVNRMPIFEYFLYLFIIIVSLSAIYDLARERFTTLIKWIVVSALVIIICNNLIIYNIYINFSNNSSVYGSQVLRNEILKISKFLEQQNQKNEIKVLLMPREFYGFKDSYSMVSLESMLNLDYYYLPFEESISQDFLDGVFKLQGYFPKAYVYANLPRYPIDKFDYIITTVNNADFSGIEPVNLEGVGQFFKIYKTKDSEFRVTKITSNLYDDKWNNGEVKIRIYSQSNEVKIEFKIDAPGNPKNPKVEIKDNTGRSLVQEVGDSLQNVYFIATRAPGEKYVEVSLNSSDTFVPNHIDSNSSDGRELSFRLLETNVVE